MHILLWTEILIYHHFKFTFDSGQDGCCSPSVAVIQSNYNSCWFAHMAVLYRALMSAGIARYTSLNTWRDNNVVLTSKRRHYYVMCLLGQSAIQDDRSARPGLRDTGLHHELIKTSNGSWCIGIKGEMSGTVCVTFTWDIYIYICVVYSFCLFCCLFIIVTWWYMWCIVWQVESKRKYRHVW